MWPWKTPASRDEKHRPGASTTAMVEKLTRIAQKKSRPHRSVGTQWRRPRAALLVLGWALLAVLPAGSAITAAGPPLVKLEATITYAEPVRATAFSADESLIAAATGKEGATIIINDRRSKGQLGRIATEAGAAPKLVFSPDSSLLLVAGGKALELWEVPIGPLKPGEDLPRTHLRWRVPADGDAPLGAAGFGGAPGIVVWSAGNKIYRRGTSGESPYSGQPAATVGEISGGTLRLALPGGGGRIAAHRPGEKSLTLLDPKAPGKTVNLEGHRFPVVSAQFDHRKSLVSVDSGFNLIRWGTDGQPKSVNYLNPPEGMRNPVAALPIASQYHLVLTGGAAGFGGGPGGAVIVDADKGKVRAVLKSLQPAASSVSPTGRYIAAVKGKNLRLLGFAQPLPAREYVKELKSRGALKVARNFTNYLDDTGLPSQLKSQLTALLDRTPAKLGLEDFLASMNSAVAENNPDNMIYWATKVLDVEENHPQAMAVMAKVAEMREGRVFSQARAALELGQHRQAIATLSSQVPASSSRYSEALEIIRQAELERALQTSLEQARDKLNLGDYSAARALVNEILRKEEHQPAALVLLEEISERSSNFYFEPLTFVFLALLGVVLLTGGIYRLRNLLAPFLRRFSLIPAAPGPGRPSARPGDVAGEAVRAPMAAAPKTGGAPRQDAYEKERRRQVQEMFERTEEMIRMARQADVVRQHSSFLLELEAELSAMHRRLGDAHVELPAMRQRLEAILVRLRRLKFSKVLASHNLGRGATYYDILNLTPRASDFEIKEAYHKMLKEYHPDLHRQSSFGWVKTEAEQMSKKLSEAYEVLSDSYKREQYNRTLPKRKGAHT